MSIGTKSAILHLLRRQLQIALQPTGLVAEVGAKSDAFSMATVDNDDNEEIYTTKQGGPHLYDNVFYAHSRETSLRFRNQTQRQFRLSV